MDQLNPEQQRAAAHLEGPLLVLAGAGSGKTRVVTYRIAHLLSNGVSPGEILAVTFTNKAAQEMRKRIEDLTRQSILACTFHSLCARILREAIAPLGFSTQFAIYDEEDSEKLLRECMTAMRLQVEKGALRRYRTAISKAKNHLMGPEKYCLGDPVMQVERDLYIAYQAKLKECDALDFDDLLFKTVQLFREFPNVLAHYQSRWRFILIDEYQDTNSAQHALVKQLSAMHNNVFAVGDPDQSIYSWRGAEIRNILNFTKDFPGAKKVMLEQNYRSRANILHAANHLIKNNDKRYEKKLWSERGSGDPIEIYEAATDREEATFVVGEVLRLHRAHGIPLRECVVFYRTNFQSRIFEDALLRSNVPYVIVGGVSFYQRKEIKDVLSYLRLLLNPSDVVAFRRTINIPKRGIGEGALEKLEQSVAATGLPIVHVCQKIAEGSLDAKLTSRQLAGIREYARILHVLGAHKGPISELMRNTLACTRYKTYLQEDPTTAEERLENVEELISKAREWEQDKTNPTLSSFLEELSLRGASDEKDPSVDAVRLMTVHHGKGLEFTAVFLVGMEEGLFPHFHVQLAPKALEEERRLCYVGMTRAKDYLYLTHASSRLLWGDFRHNPPSRFLDELPCNA